MSAEIAVLEAKQAPAVAQRPVASLTSRPLMPSVAEWTQMKDMAGVLARSGMLPPAVQKAEQAVAIMLKGWELGFPLMASFEAISIISGKPCIAATAMMALVQRNIPGSVFEVVESADSHCKVRASRPGRPELVFAFTMGDAERAGLTGKQNWRSYPRAMLRSRAVSETARSVFPDGLMGCLYTPEELAPDVPLVETESGDLTPAAPVFEEAANSPQPRPVNGRQPFLNRGGRV